MHGLGPVYALITVASTAVGGLVGIRLRSRLEPVMAFTGGVVLGVALFDLAPEAVDRLGGAVSGHTAPQHAYAIGLAVFAGVFLMIWTLELLAEAHHLPSPARVALTVTGAAFIYLVTRIV